MIKPKVIGGQRVIVKKPRRGDLGAMYWTERLDSFHDMAITISDVQFINSSTHPCHGHYVYTGPSGFSFLDTWCTPIHDLPINYSTGSDKCLICGHLGKSMFVSFACTNSNCLNYSK